MSESMNNKWVQSESKKLETHRFLPWVTKDDLINEKLKPIFFLKHSC